MPLCTSRYACTLGLTRFFRVALVLGLLPLAADRAAATQVVYLNFDRTAGTDYNYSQLERDSIQLTVEQDYAPFDFMFTQSQPASGEYSTLFFNDGPALGIAEGIDFRNLNKSDNALININGSVTDSEEFIRLSASTAAHELGHLLGLRHRDSFGPIGSGVDPNTFNTFLPRFTIDDDGFLIGSTFDTYPGPYAATDTLNHIMESDSFFVENTVDQYFGARESIKLAFNEQGSVIPETAGFKQSISTAQPISLSPITVPNQIEQGALVGAEFFVNAVAVTGKLGFANERDFYQFDGLAGQMINVEVVSGILEEDRYNNTIDSLVTLYNSNGEVVDYYGAEATNDNEFESTDSVLIDLFLPADDTYYLEIESFETSDTGNYELFVYDYRFEKTERFLTPDAIPFDLNSDALVDAADYTILRDMFDDTVTPGAPGDFDNNGKIDELDIEKWQLNYASESTLVFTEGPTQLPGGGAPVFDPFDPFGPGNAVPEPASALLTLVVVGAGLLGRRRI